MIISTVALISAISFIGLTFVVSFAMGVWYSRYYYDGSELTGSRKWPAFQRCISTLFYPIQRYYFSYEVVYTDDNQSSRYMQADKDYTAIFSAHPHGLMAIGSFFNVGIPMTSKTNQWTNVIPCTHRHVFAIPVLREIALWLGAIDVSKNNIVKKLETHSIYIAAGGCREMIIDEKEPIQSKHRGFLSIAYDYKKLVFPVIHTGQEKIFRSFSCCWLDKVRHIILDMTGYPFPTFIGPPMPRKLTTYVLHAHDPSSYDCKEDFIKDYYTKLHGMYDKLSA